MDKKILFNLFLYHLGIIFCSIVLANLFSDELSENLIVTILNILLIISLYVISGYINANRLSKIYNYFSVFYIGLILWFICFYVSPQTTNYKQNGETGLWLIYEIYIFPKFIFYEFLPKKYSLIQDLSEKLFFSFLFSLFQYLGKLIKIRR